MQMQSFYRRACIALCVIQLCSCSTSPCRQWVLLDSGPNCNPSFRAARMLLGPDSASSRLELEIDRNQAGIRVYLNLFLFVAPCLPEDPSRTAIEVTVGEETLTFYLYRLAGGQRLLLPPEVADYFIRQLSENQPFSIKIGRSYISVISDNFQLNYQQLMELPIEEYCDN